MSERDSNRSEVSESYNGKNTSNSTKNTNQNEELTNDKKLDDLLDKAGGIGKFQILAYLAITLGMFSTNFFFYEIGYFLQEPAYTCTYKSPVQDPDEICTAKNICSGDPIINSWQIDYSSSRTLNNWQQKLDLMC